MIAGEIIIKTKLAVDDFKKQLEKVKDIAKEKTSKIGDVLSKIFDKISPQIRNVIFKTFSALTSISKVLLKTVRGTLKAVTGLGLGLGVTSILIGGMLSGVYILAKAFEKIVGENGQIKTDIQYIVFAIGKALDPAINSVADVIQKILNWLIQIVRYTALFINLWAGKNVFEGATAEAFAESMKEAEKSSSKTAKNAKEIKKQLAGFDEMNVLSDNSSGGTTTGGGISTPSFDLSNLGDLEVPEWMKWIVDNKDLVIAGLIGIASALLLVQLGLTGIFGGAIVGLIVALVALIIMNWDKIKEVLGQVWSWIDENIIQPVVAGFLWLWDKIVEIFGPAISFFADIFSAIWGTLSNVLSTIWSNIKIVIDNVVSIVKGLWNTIKNVLLPIYKWVWDNILMPFVRGFKQIIEIVWGLIKTVATTVGDVIGKSFKGVVNGVLVATETILNSPISQINKLIKLVNKIPGLDNLKSLKTFSFPKLAKGTIVSAPGKGVPTPSGNALYGEAGREAYLPLSDTQLLEELGSTIGKYVNIQATIPVYVGNRQIAREIRKINAEDDFAYNGG